MSTEAAKGAVVMSMLAACGAGLIAQGAWDSLLISFGVTAIAFVVSAIAIAKLS
jgi:hypothetical protein